jgi:hypothetical protein
MAEVGKAQRLALEAVARHFSAPWQSGDSPPDAYLTVAGRRVGLEIAVMAQQHRGRGRIPKARFRDDAVARRVLRALNAALCGHVPDGKTLVLTLGAPIKEPKKVLAALTDMLLTHLQRGAAGVEQKKTLLRNRVRFLLANDGLAGNSKLTGFVFSGDPKPGALLKAMRSLQVEIDAHAKKRSPTGFSGDRWLALVSDQWIGDAKTYRSMLSHLSIPGRFTKILIVLDGGRVENLTEEPPRRGRML